MAQDGGEALTDVLIVGAGFAGLYMLHRLRQSGFRAVVLEAGTGVGGTWFWNRYPGARCDIESTQYSYQFSPELEQDWTWSERYAAQPEILSYAEHVAERFDLRRDIVFSERVVAARFDGVSGQWRVATATGGRYAARYIVFATGCLSVPAKPDIPGLAGFDGCVHHTAEWPSAGMPLAGRRVALIGTGSSGIQAVPVIARDAAHLTVFQRTANYAIPARNIALPAAIQDGIKAIYRDIRARARLTATGVISEVNPQKALEVSEEQRHYEYERRWQRGGLTFLEAFSDLLTDQDANETAAEFVRAKIRAIVKDPSVARRLSPTGPIGARRLCVDMGYYEAFNRPNVTLVDAAATPIERVTETGVVAGGREYPADTIVLATGFDAMTGAIDRVEVTGPGGRTMREAWAHGPRTLLGLMVHGFPNLFTVTGPGSPSVLTNLLPSIELNVGWIADCLVALRSEGLGRIEPTAMAEQAWVEEVARAAGETLRGHEPSWYAGANIPGKPRVFMPYAGGFARYAAICEDVAAKGYEGFTLGVPQYAAT